MNSFNLLSSYNLAYQNKDAMNSPLSIHKFKNTVVLLNVKLEEPALETLKLFRGKLLEKAKKVEFKDVFVFKPSFVAYEYYGDINLGYIILYINDFYCKRDFTNKRKNFLLIPDKNSIMNLYKFQQQNGKVVNKTIDSSETTLYKL